MYIYIYIFYARESHTANAQSNTLKLVSSNIFRIDGVGVQAKPIMTERCDLCDFPNFIT